MHRKVYEYAIRGMQAFRQLWILMVKSKKENANQQQRNILWNQNERICLEGPARLPFRFGTEVAL
jgi:beta-xylosidase